MSSNDSLSMLDQFGDRRRIIPAEVTGYFQRRRQWVSAVLLLIFMGLPWIKIGGLQALHFDIPQRRFTIAGVTLRQVDALLHQNDMPIALLGMSFLNRMEMKLDGGTMTLRQRY